MSLTIASVEDVRVAGNLSARISLETLQFYLDISSVLFAEMVGSTIYAAAVAKTIDSAIILRFRRSEALMAVGLSLPAVAMTAGETGILSQLSLGAGGLVEKMSFVKEVQALAATFLNLAQQLSAGYILQDGYENVWYNVVMRMFPSLDEMPTVATIKSDEETLLKQYRGDEGYEEYNPEQQG